MIKFTKEEISLCKQVAEKYRKEIEYGDWSLNEGGFVKVWPYRHDCKRTELIPLWTISDCLEFSRERKPQMEFELVYGDDWKLIFHWTKTYTGKTPLEAFLKAVLAVLEEGK